MQIYEKKCKQTGHNKTIFQHIDKKLFNAVITSQMIVYAVYGRCEKYLSIILRKEIKKKASNLKC